VGEGRASEREDRRPDLGIRYDLDAEDVGQARAHVLAEGSQDEKLALLVEEQDSGQHGGERCAPGGVFGEAEECECLCSSHLFTQSQHIKEGELAGRVSMSIRLVDFPESRPGFGDRSSSTARPRGVHITSSFELHHSPHPLTTTLAPQQHLHRIPTCPANHQNQIPHPPTPAQTSPQHPIRQHQPQP
jgi:hypothetical protein